MGAVRIGIDSSFKWRRRERKVYTTYSLTNKWTTVHCGVADIRDITMKSTPRIGVTSVISLVLGAIVRV
jgi:hypothetical protein